MFDHRLITSLYFTHLPANIISTLENEEGLEKVGEHKKVVNVLCGTSAGNEGYAARLSCNLCMCEASIIKERT